MDQLKEYSQLVKESEKKLAQVDSQLGFFGFLEKSVAQQHLDEIQTLKSRLTSLEQQFRIDEKTNPRDAFVKEILIPYQEAVLDSTIAKIILQKENGFMDSKTRYELYLQTEALTPKDVEGVVDDYHKEVERFLKTQKELSSKTFQPIGARGVPQYKRTCEVVISTLDELASKLFRRRITTPADFDVKERSPHQFLGQINVGYEHYQEQLVRTIGHEGPFGHNTHSGMSQQTPFNYDFRHTGEGLAILGEILSLQEFYRGREDINAIIELLMSKRRMGDTSAAAYEKLAFHDKLSPQKIAKELNSPLYPEQLMIQKLANLEQGRESIFNFAATPYYVGGEQVIQIYNNAISQLKGQERFEERRSNLIQAMYSGNRPTKLMKKQIEYDLSHTAFRSQQ